MNIHIGEELIMNTLKKNTLCILETRHHRAR